MHAGDLRLGYGLNAQLFDFRAKMRRQNLLQYVLLNLIRKFSANHGFGNFAGSKPGDASHAAVLLHHGGEGLTHFIGSNFNIHLASALRI